MQILKISFRQLLTFTTPTISSTEAVVSSRATFKNEYKVAEDFTLLSKIVNNSGTVLNPITSVQKIEPFSTIEIVDTGKIQKPLRWLPEWPTLYKVQTEISDNGNIIDS